MIVRDCFISSLFNKLSFIGTCICIHAFLIAGGLFNSPFHKSSFICSLQKHVRQSACTQWPVNTVNTASLRVSPRESSHGINTKPILLIPFKRSFYAVVEIIMESKLAMPSKVWNGPSSFVHCTGNLQNKIEQNQYEKVIMSLISIGKRV